MAEPVTTAHADAGPDRAWRVRKPLRRLAYALAIGALTAGCGGSSHSTHSPQSATSVTSTRTMTNSTTTSMEATASAGSSNEVTASADKVTATMRGSTHAPKVGARWPFQFTVMHNGQPARATVTYEYVFAGQVVARRESHGFDGHSADEIEWPSSAVGYPLEFRAAIVSDGATINLDYPVRVVR